VEQIKRLFVHLKLMGVQKQAREALIRQRWRPAYLPGSGAMQHSELSKNTQEKVPRICTLPTWMEIAKLSGAQSEKAPLAAKH
jgi:hypothetical protein